MGQAKPYRLTSALSAEIPAGSEPVISLSSSHLSLICTGHTHRPAADPPSSFPMVSPHTLPPYADGQTRQTGLATDDGAPRLPSEPEM